MATDDKGATTYQQENAFGDVIITINGDYISCDEVIWEVLQGGEMTAFTDQTKLFCLFDMCR